MKNKSLSIASIAALTMGFLMWGCTENSSSATKEITDQDRESIYCQELLYNHFLLSAYYYDAHLKNELNSDPDVYFKVLFTADFSKGACTSRYADVCGMYNQMSDRYTRYYDPEFSDGIMKALTESPESVGIGAEVDVIDNALVFTEIFRNSPAYFAGLQEGDIITAVNYRTITSQADYEEAIQGQKLDIIKIAYIRDGESHTAVIQLDSFNAPTVHLAYKSGIPVITIDEFTDITANEYGTYGEFHERLQKIVDNGDKSLIIDLRDNGGGTIEHCENASADLLSKGEKLATFVEATWDSVQSGIQNKIVQKFDTTTDYAEVDGIGKDLYVVFLANENTASCSEIMLMNITSNKASPIVGTTTYGKGIGQGYSETFAGGIFGITDAHIFDKNGETYHSFGIEPDHLIYDPDKQMAKAVEIATLRTEKRTAGYGKVSTGNFDKEAAGESSEAKVLDRDYIRRGAGNFRFKKVAN